MSNLDLNRLAKNIVGQATGEISKRKTKNRHAVKLGRLGGLKGGKVTASKLKTKEERVAMGKKLANARWDKYRKESKQGYLDFSE